MAENRGRRHPISQALYFVDEHHTPRLGGSGTPWAGVLAAESVATVMI